jgi:tetratricopeptide (TPR) repeat protein
MPPGRFAPTADQQIRIYQARLEDNPRETASWERLAVGYMRMLRESGDIGYALRAEQALHQALALDPHDSEARKLLAWVALAKHEFADALQQTEVLIGEGREDDGLYGILADANVELGRYPEAQQALQRMIDLKPGLSAYTRVAYLRELHGDIRGAIAMMQLAVEAINSRDRENVAWTRVQIGHLYLSQGDLGDAEEQYAQALQAFPGYHYALAGLGTIRAAHGRFAEAIQLYTQALAIVPLPEVAAALGDVYVRLGRPAEAERNYALVEFIGRLTQLNKVVYNRELAYFYADHDRGLDQAVRLADREATVRHDIYTADVRAWAYLKAGRVDQAEQMMGAALALGTRDPRLFYHAGMIAWKRGDRPRAKLYLAMALRTNPQFHVLHVGTARHVMAELGE